MDFINSAFDIIEGIVAGGLMGFGAYVITGAVQTLSGSFLVGVNPVDISVIVGALGFIGYSLPNLRKRVSKDVENVDEPKAN